MVLQEVKQKRPFFSVLSQAIQLSDVELRNSMTGREVSFYD